MKSKIKAIQRAVGVTPDGIIGPLTLSAIAERVGAKVPPCWPTQAEVRTGGSIFGEAGCEGDLVSIAPPYPLFYEGKKLSTIRVHRLIATHVASALREVLEHYGEEGVRRLGLDQYGGSYNFRRSTNGYQYSMHAWGIALDFAPATNAYNTRAPEATLSRPECAAWWQIWESHGAVSLGRERGFDWMHVQFAALN